MDAALLAWNLSCDGDAFADGNIQRVTRMGREGMKSTNIEILNIMVGK